MLLVGGYYYLCSLFIRLLHLRIDQRWTTVFHSGNNLFALRLENCEQNIEDIENAHQDSLHIIQDH